MKKIITLTTIAALILIIGVAASNRISKTHSGAPLKVIVNDMGIANVSDAAIPYSFVFVDTTYNPDQVVEYYQDVFYFQTQISKYSVGELDSLIYDAINNRAIVQDYTIGEVVFYGSNMRADWDQSNPKNADYIANKPDVSGGTRTFNNSPSHSIVTTAAAANGFQLSSSRDADVSYSCNIITVSTLLNASVGYIVLEVAPTNSSTPGDWTEISRVGSGQSGIVSTETLTATLTGTVPASYYLRLRSVNTAGTPTYSYISGQEVLL